LERMVQAAIKRMRLGEKVLEDDALDQLEDINDEEEVVEEKGEE